MNLRFGAKAKLSTLVFCSITLVSGLAAADVQCTSLANSAEKATITETEIKLPNGMLCEKSQQPASNWQLSPLKISGFCTVEGNSFSVVANPSELVITSNGFPLFSGRNCQ